ncbi:MAG TPA: efflux RND transporter permease subunit [Candidatus Kapabacteria bacterium]|nr:efflux RND transporter permease subunit [Candidatus Kapabacteria bacterium]
MFISDFAIKRPVVTVVTMIALVIFGLFALASLQIDEFPDITNPIVVVAVPYPGASPEQVEREVVDRMEEAFGSISGLDKMTSQSLDGFGMITIQFVFSKNPDEAMADVRDAISTIQNDLPVEMKPPILEKFDPDELPIVSLVLRSPGMAPADLTSLADPGIKKELSAIEGVAQVSITGAVDREIAVNVRPSDLEANGVSVAQVVQALEAQNLAAPVGALETPQLEQSIRLAGRIENPNDFNYVPIATRNGQVVRLQDVASVADTAKEARTLALFNGKECVGLDITKAKGASTATVADAVVKAIDGIKKNLPPGTTLEVVKNAGDRVTHSVTNVKEALLEGALLTVLVVFLFLNSWRSTVITGLALPVSVLAAFVAVLAAGFTLNTMSLLGLSLAIGILIDDAIVVRENIVRHVEMGEDHMTAAHSGTNEIGLAVTATTFSIIAVFVPVAFMGGLSGQWFKPFALTVACAVLVSLFVSFSLDPMLSAYWPDPHNVVHKRRAFLPTLLGVASFLLGLFSMILGLLPPLGSFLLLGLGILGLIFPWLDQFNNWFNRTADGYKRVIAWALDHRWWMVAIAIVAFVGAIFVQAKYGGSGFVPNSDRSELTISVEAPPGSSLPYTLAKTQEITSILRAHKEVAYTYTTIGSETTQLGTSSGSGDVTQASIYVKLIPKADRNLLQWQLAEVFRKQLATVGGVDAYVFSSGFGGAQKEVQLQVQGSNEASMEQAASTIEDAIRKVPGTADIGLSTKGQKPELEVNLRRGLIGSMGLTVAQVAQSLLPAFAGLKTGDWVDPTGKTRDVTVRLAPEARESAANLAQIPLVLTPSASGSAAVVPLGQIADITEGLGPAEIDHLNQDRVINVECNSQGLSLGQVSQNINAVVAKLKLPPGVRVSNGGQVQQQGEFYLAIFEALGLAIMLMYLILVVQFGSFLDPIAILISLPLSLIGVVIALLVTGDTMNVMALIGIMLLMGIVAKNAILLIDFAKWQHEAGMPLREALIEAGRVRLRPIMMTTMALIAGMIPVAIGAGEGADFRAPLGRAVIGGVITSTILTLVVIPTIYEIFAEWREKLGRRFRKVVVHEPTNVPVDQVA